MGALANQNHLTSATTVQFSTVRLHGSSGAILQLTEQALNNNGTRTTGPNAVQRSNVQDGHYCT